MWTIQAAFAPIIASRVGRYLQADAYAGYDELHRGGKMIEVGCWAHARRKFHDARNSDSQRSHHVLGLIRQLYAIEKQAKKDEMDAAQVAVLRQHQAKAILDRLHKYLLNERDAVLPQSPMGEAITYTLNQWDALVRYTTDGDLAIGRVEVWRGGQRLSLDADASF